MSEAAQTKPPASGPITSAAARDMRAFEAALAAALRALDPFLKDPADFGFILSVLIAAARADHKLDPGAMAAVIAHEFARGLKPLCAAGRHIEAACLLRGVLAEQGAHHRLRVAFLLDDASPKGNA
jgi:hypothetical protein